MPVPGPGRPELAMPFVTIVTFVTLRLAADYTIAAFIARHRRAMPSPRPVARPGPQSQTCRHPAQWQARAAVAGLPSPPP